MTFQEVYKSKSRVRKVQKCESAQFIEEIAALTMQSKLSIYRWAKGTYRPDKLAQAIISQYLGIPVDELFPPKQEEPTITK